MDNPAAWHPDPAGKHDHRWWDGQRWTEHVADAGVASIDPLPDVPSPTDATARGSDPAATSAADDARGAGPTDDGATETGPTEVGSTDSGPVDTGPTVTDPTVTGPADARPTGGDLTDGAHDGTDLGGSGSTAAGGGAPGPSDGAGTAGTGPASDAPAWAQQPSQQPSQQPWSGAPASGGYQGQPPAWTDAAGGQGGRGGSSGMAIGSLICGIVAIPLAIVGGIGALLGIVAVVLAVIVLRREKRGEAGGRGIAIGGLVTGGISIVLGIVVVIFLFTFGMGVFGEMEACLEETGGDEQECQRRLERDLTERFLDG